MNTTTPNIINPNIRKLTKNLGIKNEPFWVDVCPDSNSIKDECFINVENKIKTSGGKIVYGWAIWEWKDVLLEAEFHSIWESPHSKLIDITPKVDDEKTILFIKDDKRIFTGKRIDNERIPLKDDKVIKDFINISKLLFRFVEKGSHEDNPLISTFDKSEFDRYLTRKKNLLDFINSGANENTVCFCGSNKKYKNCCFSLK